MSSEEAPKIGKKLIIETTSTDPAQPNSTYELATVVRLDDGTLGYQVGQRRIAQDALLERHRIIIPNSRPQRTLERLRKQTKRPIVIPAKLAEEEPTTISLHLANIQVNRDLQTAINAILAENPSGTDIHFRDQAYPVQEITSLEDYPAVSFTAKSPLTIQIRQIVQDDPDASISIDHAKLKEKLELLNNAQTVLTEDEYWELQQLAAGNEKSNRFKDQFTRIMRTIISRLINGNELPRVHLPNKDLNKLTDIVLDPLEEQDQLRKLLENCDGFVKRPGKNNHNPVDTQCFILPFKTLSTEMPGISNGAQRAVKQNLDRLIRQIVLIPELQNDRYSRGISGIFRQELYAQKAKALQEKIDSLFANGEISCIVFSLFMPTWTTRAHVPDNASFQINLFTDEELKENNGRGTLQINDYVDIY